MNEKKVIPPDPAVTSVTVMGITLTISPQMFDDLDIVEQLYYLTSSDEQNPFSVVPLLKKICGVQYPEVKKRLRQDDGRIPLKTVADFLKQVMEQAAPNSPRS